MPAIERDSGFPARVLSDGTLRLLALATLRNDNDLQRNAWCYEDPELGIHPGGLRDIVEISCAA